MLYFAYGSNMNCDQMRQRCPSARFFCIAKLKDHRLVFPRTSNKRRCGVASISASKGCEVWGVVFQIDELEREKLDSYEGYNPGSEPKENSYLRTEIQVAPDGDETRTLSVFTYVANPQPGEHKPSRDYKKTILDGARFWNLPAHYIRKLEAISVSG
jgi:gamma-glutamylcyclotransferase